MQFDNTPLDRVERFCLSRYYYPALAVVIAIGVAALLRIIGG